VEVVDWEERVEEGVERNWEREDRRAANPFTSVGPEVGSDVLFLTDRVDVDVEDKGVEMEVGEVGGEGEGRPFPLESFRSRILSAAARSTAFCLAILFAIPLTSLSLASSICFNIPYQTPSVPFAHSQNRTTHLNPRIR
jgi:hypothetical protein